MINKKNIFADIILIVSLLVVAAICLVIASNINKTNKPIAKIYVQDDVVETIDLCISNDEHFYIEGLHGEVHVHTKDGMIGIIESTCPHKDCIHMGYTNSPSHPIICAYNAVSIVIEGPTSAGDVEV